ncbi:MAG: FmdB family transcriptional regulator [Rhodanobacter denitrificans]|uniref:FmdB family transcriptional regulator n=1 Tax=Rhodanobacter denitrificans TaxID=666685 RepID=A0A2W5MHX1_9GAMM|nr:MAG: FmdB family transcriptional regulator [Rhodanobacter denitrificans]
MPIHHYRPREADTGCPQCRAGFDLLQRLADPALTACPSCAAPVERVISAPQVVSGGAHHLRESNVAKNGFTQYRRIGKGLYEKTAGKGPDVISGD